MKIHTLSNAGRNKAMEISAQFQRMGLSEGVKWTEVFNSEEEIINALKRVHIIGKYDRFPLLPYRGYEYIHSFAWVVQNGHTLTERQMTMAKRLSVDILIASSIAKYFSIENA